MKKIASFAIILAIGGLFATPGWAADPAPAAKPPAEKGSSAAKAPAAPAGKEPAAKDPAAKDAAGKESGAATAPAGKAVPAPTVAASPVDIQNALQKNRRLGVALGQIKDRAIQTSIIEDIKQATAEVNTALAGVEKDPGLDPGMKSRLEEFKTVWAEFQKTREEEVFPAALAGNMEEVRRIGTVTQLGRFRRMMVLLEPYGE